MGGFLRRNVCLEAVLKAFLWVAFIFVSRRGLAVRRLAGKQKDLGSNRFGSLSLLFKNCGVWTLSCDLALTVNETLKWLTQLPTLMQNRSGGDNVASSC